MSSRTPPLVLIAITARGVWLGEAGKVVLHLYNGTKHNKNEVYYKMFSHKSKYLQKNSLIFTTFTFF